MEKLKIGWAQGSITPSCPILMEGQMYQRYSHYVHDPLTATVLALESGATQAIFVSMDITDVPLDALQPLREALADRPEIDYEKISFNVIHSHNASSFYGDGMRGRNEEVYGADILPVFPMPENLLQREQSRQFFVERIAALIVSAWESRTPGGISAAHDYAAVGFNRRPQFGGESVMYGDCSREDFTRFEGGADTAVELLYTWNCAGEVTGVVCNVPCPSQVYELHCFLSADFWAPTRSKIREKLQKNVYILPVCGAAGDVSPVDLVQISKTNRQALRAWGGQTREVFRDFDMTLVCQGIGARIAEAVERGYQTAKNYIEFAPIFVHEVLEMALPIRRVSEADYQEAMGQVAEIKKKFSKDHPMEMTDLVAAFEPQGVILRYREQNKTDEFAFKCHILRLGEIAIATNPFELFQEFGLRIKARAAAEQVFIVQLANGNGSYLPTQAAVQGGSYSSKPASTRCGPEGGDVLVEKTLCRLNELWQ